MMRCVIIVAAVVWGCGVDHTPAGTAAAAGDQAASAPAPHPGPPSCVAFDEHGELRCHTSNFAARERAVLGDRSAWAATWADIHRNRHTRPPLPSVDFSTDVLLFAATGMRNSGGYSIEFGAVTERERAVEAEVIETSPGPACAVTAAVTYPFTVKRIPRTHLPIAFVERERVRACDG